MFRHLLKQRIQEMLFDDKIYSRRNKPCCSMFFFSVRITDSAAKYLLLLIAFTYLSTHTVLAQISHGGKPYSFTNDLPDDVPVVTMQTVDVQALLAEDQAERQQNRPVPLRFAVAHEVDIDVKSAGVWTDLPDGSRLYRLRIVSKSAYSMHLVFNRFKLPPGGELFIYDENRSTVLGAFTEKNNKPHGHFSTLPIKGTQLTLEFHEPAEYKEKTELKISRVMHGYRNIFNLGTRVVGDSANCEINVNCSQGNNWQDEKRSVAMIVANFGQGSSICTGALVNNERKDLSSYFLTAYHCLDSDRDGTVESNEEDDVWTWGFWFNYESRFCSGSDVGHDAMSGSDLVALNRASDFALLELNDLPPASYNTFYAGWSAQGSTPSSSVTIHHPQGDIKKISIDNAPATSGTWNLTPPDSHWETYFDQGTAEYGSSGAPLFDSNHRIVGQLHGNADPAFTGFNFCEVPHIWFGKFSMSWNYGSSASTRLKDWLDPDNTGIQKLNGIEGPQELNVTISGPDQIFEGTSYTWTASVSEGNPSYDSYIWYKKIGSSPWYFACTSSTTSCTTSLEDGDSQTSPGYIKLEVNDEIPKYYGEDIYPLVVYESGAKIAADRSKNPERIPDSFNLQPAYPNPFNPLAVIPFQLPRQGHVKMDVYDITGHQVEVLTNQIYEAGYHRITFDAQNQSSGTYFVRIRFEGEVKTQKIVLIK